MLLFPFWFVVSKWGQIREKKTKKLQWFDIATVKSDMYIEMKQTLELLSIPFA